MLRYFELQSELRLTLPPDTTDILLSRRGCQGRLERAHSKGIFVAERMDEASRFRCSVDFGAEEPLVLSDEEWSRRPLALAELLGKEPLFFASLIRVAETLLQNPETIALRLMASRIVWPRINTFWFLDDAAKTAGDAFPTFDASPVEEDASTTAQLMEEYARALPDVHTSTRRSLRSSSSSLSVASRRRDFARIRAAIALTAREGVPNPVKLARHGTVAAAAAAAAVSSTSLPSLFHRTVDAISFKAALVLGLPLVPVDTSELDDDDGWHRGRLIVVREDWKDVHLFGGDEAVLQFRPPKPAPASDWGGRSGCRGRGIPGEVVSIQLSVECLREEEEEEKTSSKRKQQQQQQQPRRRHRPSPATFAVNAIRSESRTKNKKKKNDDDRRWLALPLQSELLPPPGSSTTTTTTTILFFASGGFPLVKDRVAIMLASPGMTVVYAHEQSVRCALREEGSDARDGSCRRCRCFGIRGANLSPVLVASEEEPLQPVTVAGLILSPPPPSLASASSSETLRFFRVGADGDEIEGHFGNAIAAKLARVVEGFPLKLVLLFYCRSCERFIVSEMTGASAFGFILFYCPPFFFYFFFLDSSLFNFAFVCLFFFFFFF